MRICFVTSGQIEEFSGDAKGADLVLFPFHALGEVSYERELKGETYFFEDVAILSKELKNVVICGCYTLARGVKRKSVVVAEAGRILGVSDMVNRIDGSDFNCGAGVKLYDTSAGKIGVIVAEDLYFPQVLETLSRCGADVAVSIFEELNENLEQTLIRAGGFFYGIPVCMCAYGFAQAADSFGKLRFASPISPCVYSLEREQEYHIVETRRKMSLRKKNEF